MKMPCFLKSLSFIILVLSSFGLVNSVYAGVLTPPNDLCENAIEVTCGQSVSGSTLDASSADAPEYCDSYYLDEAGGVWYKFEGDGQVVIASLCNSGFDTQIGIFSGTCGDLECVAANDDANCGLASEVSFFSEEGITYYIYVTGFDLFEVGDYVLTITCLSSDPPANDLCVNALPIVCGEVASGITINASTQGAPEFCGAYTINTAGGVWYTFAGNGELVRASLCNSSFDTQIAIFSGNCNNLECVAANDDFCDSASEVLFGAEEGEIYYIYVTGYFNSTGVFELFLECLGEPLPNDLCFGAIPVSCGETVNGSTLSATNTGAPEYCDSYYLNEGGGVWYLYEGGGQDVVVSLCGSDFDTQIGIFSSSCDDLVCVAANDDFCDVQSEVAFFAEENETYWIYVTSYGTEGGFFELNIECESQQMTATPGNVSFSANGGDVPVVVSSNIAWTASEAVNWLELENPSGGAGSGVFSIICAPNQSAQPRNAVVTLSGSGISATVVVTQAGQTAGPDTPPWGVPQGSGLSGILLGQALINGSPATGDDWVAAFDEDGNLAGSVKLQSTGGQALINLEIFGDDPSTPGIDEGITGAEKFRLVLFDVSESKQIDYNDMGAAILLSDWVNTSGAPMPQYDDIGDIYDFITPSHTSEQLAGVDKFAVWPNPNRGEFRLEIVLIAPVAGKLAVYDALGRQIWTRQADLTAGRQEVNVALPLNISSGLYWVVMEGEGRVCGKRFFVE